MLAACLFVMGTTHVMADDKKDDAPSVPIPLTAGGKLSGDDYRGNAFVPFTAYYQRGTIYVSTSAEFTVISINVENESQTWDSATDVSDGMGEISIANGSTGSTGSYTVEIVTEYGECFVGRFTIL